LTSTNVTLNAMVKVKFAIICQAPMSAPVLQVLKRP